MAWKVEQSVRFCSPLYGARFTTARSFVERCLPLREGALLLAVAGNRNGGQKLVVQQILTAMLTYGPVSVGRRSPAMLGSTLWSAKDEVSPDELGLQSAKLLGPHVAEVDTALVATIPGTVRTEMVKIIPLGHLGAPSEVANVARLLCSPLASYIMGQTLEVSGGWRG